MAHREITATPMSGYIPAAALALLGLFGVYNFLNFSPVIGIPCIALTVFGAIGLFMVHPNEAKVLQLFGSYVGTAKEPGLRWANPLYAKRAVSLRVRNFESGKLRNLATSYPYEAAVDGEKSLRGDPVNVAEALKEEIQARLQEAGVQVIEARISHLAYAPEIASAMLRRQQASAIIAAREQIVAGAVGMVQMALEQLERDAIVELDEERKAAMVTR